MVNIADFNHCSTGSDQAVQAWVCGESHIRPSFADEFQEQRSVKLRRKKLERLISARDPGFLDWPEGIDIMDSLGVNKLVMIAVLDKLTGPPYLTRPNCDASNGAKRRYNGGVVRWNIGIVDGPAYKQLEEILQSCQSEVERQRLEREGRALLTEMLT